MTHHKHLIMSQSYEPTRLTFNLSPFHKTQRADKLDLNWKKYERKPRHTVFQIDKIDNFQGLGCPIVRWRSTIQGPCVGVKFAEFIMNIEERAKWDPQILQVDEIYPIYDVDAANIAMGWKYGGKFALYLGII